MGETEHEEWRAVAAALQEHGVPKRRAEVVALVDAGESYSEICEQLGIGNRGDVSRHVQAYRKSLEEAGWLAEHGPEV